MKLAGLQNTSLIDYPKHIVSILFTQGCNLMCPYCHNSSLIALKKEARDYLPLDYLWDFLSKRKGLIDGVSITGGEPTLQPDLIDFIKQIKSMNLKVKLDTNGTNPKILKELIKNNLLDYVAMDVKAPLDKYDKVAGNGNLVNQIIESINLIKQSNIDYEFRTTVVPGLHDSEDIMEIGKLIKGAKQYYIQNFKPNNTLNPDFMNIIGFPPVKLNEFKDIIKDYVENVEIRN